MKTLLIPLACGTLFGFGLALSGMTDTQKVIGFLDILGDWDPTLAFVMGGGLLVTIPVFQLGLGRLKKPLFEPEFHLPTRRIIDFRLVGGAVLFGVGWGLLGYCPGPAIGSVVYLNPDILFFIGAMCIGMVAVEWIEQQVISSHIADETTD